MDGWMDEWIKWMDRCMDGDIRMGTDGWMDGCMDGWMDGWMGMWMGMDGLRDVQVGVWFDRRMNEQIVEQMLDRYQTDRQTYE